MARAPSVPGPYWQMPVGLPGCARPVGIDHHQPGPVVPGVLDVMPGVQVGADAVAAPDDDVLRVGETLRVNAAGGAVGQYPGRCRPFAAEGALAHRRAQLVEEGIAAVQSVYQPLVPQVAVRGNGLGTVLVDNVFPSADHFVQRLVPGNAFELLTALGAGPAQRIEHAIGMVMAFLIIIELDTQAPAGHGMIGVAVYTGEFAVFDFEHHGTSIRTIMRATAVIGFFKLCGHGKSPFDRNRIVTLEL